MGFFTGGGSGGGGGSGDVTGQSSSVDSEITLFSGTTGKAIKRATGTGFVTATAGVYGTVASIAFSSLASLPSANLLVGSAGNVATATAITGDISFTNTGVTAIGANKVTLAMLAQIATARFLGRTTAGTGDVESLTSTQATALLNNMVGDSGSGGTKGLVPAPGAGDAAAAKFLKADGSWDVPAGTGTGDVVGPSSAVDNAITRFDGTTGKLVQNSSLTVSDPSSFVTTLGAPADAVADANHALDIKIQAPSKTAGTGDGGDILLQPGDSSGGSYGQIEIHGPGLSGTQGFQIIRTGFRTRVLCPSAASTTEPVFGLHGTPSAGYSWDGTGIPAIAHGGGFSAYFARTLTQFSGDVEVTTLGKAFSVKEGSNATSGSVTLVAGTATVSTTAVAANSRIQVTSNADGGTPGFLRVSTRTAGVSFTITSSNVLDTSDVAWIIIKPA